MIGHLITYIPPQMQQRNQGEKKHMTPNPHYINMIINFSILGTLIYVAIQVS
mgnify:CR=1 FL=1